MATLTNSVCGPFINVYDGKSRHASTQQVKKEKENRKYQHIVADLTIVLITKKWLKIRNNSSSAIKLLVKINKECN